MALAGVQPETNEDTVSALRLMDPRRRDVPLAKVTCYKAIGLWYHQAHPIPIEFRSLALSTVTQQRAHPVKSRNPGPLLCSSPTRPPTKPSASMATCHLPNEVQSGDECV